LATTKSNKGTVQCKKEPVSISQLARGLRVRALLNSIDRSASRDLDDQVRNTYYTYHVCVWLAAPVSPRRNSAAGLTLFTLNFSSLLDLLNQLAIVGAETERERGEKSAQFKSVQRLMRYISTCKLKATVSHHCINTKKNLYMPFRMVHCTVMLCHAT
jgi:hypothetical protein